MDRIRIRDLRIDCIVGTNPVERENKQTVVINLTLDCDLVLSGKSDNLEDTINYKTLKDEIVAMIEKSSDRLIERMAERIASYCLQHRRIFGVKVIVDKPGALTGTKSVAVEIERGKRQ